MPDTIRALTVFAHYPETLSYFSDWLDAFVAEPRLDVVRANLATPAGRWRVRREASDADLVIVLHSAIGDSLAEIATCEDALAGRRGPMIAFIGNEISLPDRPLRDKVELLARLRPQVIATQLLVDAAESLYAEVPGATVAPAPHALNPAVFRPDVPNPERPVEVGFRGARYLASIGDDDRNRILDEFAANRFEPPLVTDIRTDTSYGRRRWAQFLNRCQGTIGAESGAHEIRLETPQHEAEPGTAWRARLRPVHRYLPRPLKNALRRGANRLARAPAAAPADVGTTGTSAPNAAVSGKTISSRHFDAIGTETCQILLPGRYCDLLEADVHYLCLERDFSNVDDVLARFRDEDHRTRMVRDTRDWALDGHTYAHRVRSLLDAVGA